jgi:Hemerythrin HHE cation binding domain
VIDVEPEPEVNATPAGSPDVAPWDESGRPTAPPSDGGAVSPLGRAIGKHLVDVHDHLRQELGQIRELVDQLRAGAIGGAEARDAISQMTIRQNNWTVGAYCAAYCRLVTQHHNLESDAIFGHLRAREPGLTPVLDRLDAEHLVIHGILEEVDRGFVAFLADPSRFAALDAAVRALEEALGSHLGYEESQLITPLGRHGFYPGQIDQP